MDSARMFALFASPPEYDVVWKDEGVDGINRFLNRVWRIINTRRESVVGTAGYTGDGKDLEEAALELRRMTHKTVAGVTEDVEKRFHFNTAIAAVMELINEIYRYAPFEEEFEGDPTLLKEALETSHRSPNRW